MTAKSTLGSLNHTIQNCTACTLHLTRRHAIPGEGPVPCKMLLIAQAPGSMEDQNNRLFIGPSGKIFDRLIRHAGLKRDDFYLTNLIKCMLPKARRPARDEIERCTIYLRQEIREVRPRILVPLGFHATRFAFKEYGLDFPQKHEASRLFGTLFQTGHCQIFPLRHPTALYFNPGKKAVMQENYDKLHVLYRQ